MELGSSASTSVLRRQEVGAECNILSYYDDKKLQMIQCDASDKGIGAALFQEGQPIAFANRALTGTDTRYAQIEKEMLAIIFAAEKFDQYTFGHSVTVQSNYKPFESITRRSRYSVHLSVREEWLCDTRKATLSSGHSIACFPVCCSKQEIIRKSLYQSQRFYLKQYSQLLGEFKG